MCEPEIEAMQRIVNNEISAVENIAKSNQELKKEMMEVVQQYEEKQATFESL